MTSSHDWAGEAFAGAGAGALAIVLEHLAATEIGGALPVAPEFDIRVGQVLGTATIIVAFNAVARSGDSRTVQVAKLFLIASGCGMAAISCSAARWAARVYREGATLNGALNERATVEGRNGLLAPWIRGLGAGRRGR